MRETRTRRRFARRFLLGLAAAATFVAIGSPGASAAGCPTPNTPEPYPNCTYPSPHQLGMYDRMATSSWDFASPDVLATRTYLGMPHQHTIYDYFLRNDQGKFYLGSNAILGPGGSLTAFPWFGVGAFQGPGPGGPPGLTPDPRTHAWTTGSPVTQTLTPDGKVQVDATTSASPGGQQITYDRNSFKYAAANNEINLNGSQTGGGTNFNLPWREPNGNTNDFFYNVNSYKVEGTYQGEHVTGHVFVETMWSDVAYRASWWVRNRIGNWAFFDIDYKNGTSETGQFLCGEYGARGAIVTDQTGKSTVSTDRINASLKPNGTKYRLGNGEKWKMVSDPNLALGTIQIGAIRRSNEKRKIKSADAVQIRPGGGQCTPESLGHGNGH